MGWHPDAEDKAAWSTAGGAVMAAGAAGAIAWLAIAEPSTTHEPLWPVYAFAAAALVGLYGMLAPLLHWRPWHHQRRSVGGGVTLELGRLEDQDEPRVPKRHRKELKKLAEAYSTTVRYRRSARGNQHPRLERSLWTHFPDAGKLLEKWDTALAKHQESEDVFQRWLQDHGRGLIAGHAVMPAVESGGDFRWTVNSGYLWLEGGNGRGCPVRRGSSWWRPGCDGYTVMGVSGSSWVVVWRGARRVARSCSTACASFATSE
jgi:hypothetical protein